MRLPNDQLCYHGDTRTTILNTHTHYTHIVVHTVNAPMHPEIHIYYKLHFKLIVLIFFMRPITYGIYWMQPLSHSAEHLLQTQFSKGHMVIYTSGVVMEETKRHKLHLPLVQ